MADQRQRATSPTSIKTVKVHARDEDFRIVQLHGNLFVCSKANGSCCCGWTDKGRLAVNHTIYEHEWEQRKLRNKLHLTFTGCLGPCAVGNNALLQIYGHSIWLKDINDDALIALVFDYIEAIFAAGKVLRPSAILEQHIYARYQPAPEHYELPIIASEAADEGGLERLDPVCLMDVDPATAKYSLEYAGRMYYFCAPGCKKAFEREPQAYIFE